MIRKENIILTEEKVKQLNSLELETIKAKEILELAIKTWSQHGVKVANCQYGISIRDCEIVYYEFSDSFQGCCLMGAASIGKNIAWMGNDRAICKYTLNLTDEESFEIQNVFDYVKMPSSPLGEDVRKIRDIVFKV